jgi:hypothetical protein
MDLWMLTEETLESDTNMIRGIPTFSASTMWMAMMVMKISRVSLKTLWLIPAVSATTLKPLDIHNITRLRT